MQNVSPLNPTKAPSSSAATIADSQAQLARFLEGRKLDPETASRHGITASEGRIEIPYRREGEIKNRKYRSLVAKKFWQDGGKQFVWNYDVLLDSTLEQPILITEGEFDALAAIQSGYVRTVSVPNGGTTENVNLDWLADIENLLDSDIILAFDNDDVGHNLLEQVSLFLGKSRCKWVRYPKGCKDLNDVLMQYDEAAVMTFIKEADWVSVKGAYRMEQLAPIPYRQAMSAGMGSLDNHMKLRLGDFSICTGIPGHGKTTFLNDYINRIINKYDLKVCFASFEQPPQSDHLRALRTWYAGKLVKNMTPEEIKAADKWINEKFMFIVPGDEDTVSMEWLLERMVTVVVRHGIKIIVIDPWNEMDHQRPPGVTLTEYTGRAIRHLKAFAKKFGVHVMVVAHPAKMLRDRNGKYPIPTLYDISDSSHWANKADLGFVVHRDQEEGDTIRIVKSRHHSEIGKPGIVDVAFSQETGRYTVVDNQVMNGQYDR